MRIDEGVDLRFGLRERGGWEGEDEELALDFGAGQRSVELGECFMCLAADEQLHRECISLEEECKGGGSGKIAAYLLEDQGEIVRMGAGLNQVFERERSENQLAILIPADLGHRPAPELEERKRFSPVECTDDFLLIGAVSHEFGSDLERARGLSSPQDPNPTTAARPARAHACRRCPSQKPTRKGDHDG